ncbi:MAG: GtrA family protein [Clostridia bacterium]|nr:GtrA family protein [Clostridia bacterium]
MANKEFIRTVKFTLFSISAGIIQIGLFTLMEEVFKIDNYWICYLTSLIASVLWNFTINKKVTFRSASNVTVAMTLVLCFYLVFTPVSTVLGNLAEINGVNEYVVLAITMIANFVLEYLYTRYFVYKNSCDTAVDKTKQDVIKDGQKENNNI